MIGAADQAARARFPGWPVGSTGERVFELDWTTASRSEAVGGEAPRRRSRRAIL